jgi:CRISPR-associated protein Csy1
VFDAHGVAPQRLIVLPPQPHDDYLRINLACDAMLDTLDWSGGNTSLDALACGLPVVTLPGTYMRGRQSAAMLDIVGAQELVATSAGDYVAIATRVADDVAWRTRLRKTNGDAVPSLFDDQAPVRAFAEVLATR